MSRIRPRKWSTVLLSETLTFFVLVCALATASCGDARILRKGDESQPVAGKSDYSLKVYVTENGRTKLLEIPPLERWSVPTEQDGGDTKTPSEVGAPRDDSGTAWAKAVARSSSPVQGIIDTGAGGTIDTDIEDANPGMYPGWTLLNWARNSCWMAQEYQPFYFYGAPTPWYDDGEQVSWYVFGASFLTPNSLDDCDQQLVAQELLLCVADRLAEVAGSVGKVTWETSSALDSSSPSTITVTIPPQATKDKFIARDMAMNVLAHLVKLNSLRPYGAPWPDGSTCDDAYSTWAGATSTSLPWNWTLPRNGASRTVGAYFPPQDVPAHEEDFVEPEIRLTDMQRVGVARLERKANILSAAGRLMKALIEKSVAADLAGAEAKRAMAGDPAEGVRAEWGADADDRYNTLRHVLSVLYGRMEMGPEDDPEDGIEWDPAGPTPYDPACNGPAATDLIGSFWNSTLWQRIVPPSTAEQARALAMLQSAGIVIHPDNAASYMSANGIDVVEAQLLAGTAAALGRSVEEAGELGDAVQEQWRSTPHADRVYALGQVYSMTLLLSERAPWYVPERVRAEMAGLPVRSTDELGLTLDVDFDAAGGFVVDGGVPVGELATDVTARLAVVQTASHCDTGRGSQIWSRTADETVSTQGSFETAAVARRALEHIKGLSAPLNNTGLDGFLESATAELASWVGPAEYSYTCYAASVGCNLEIDLTGAPPSAFGVDGWDELRVQIHREHRSIS